MARVALIKVFTGLNLGVCQLSGELLRAGHETLVVYFKDYVVAPETDAERYQHSDYCGVWIAARGKEMNCNFFKPFTDREYELLIETLREFRPDLIGFSLCSVPLRQVAEVTLRLKPHFSARSSGAARVRRSSPSAASSTPTWSAWARARKRSSSSPPGSTRVRISLASETSGPARRRGAPRREPPDRRHRQNRLPDFDEARAVYINDDQCMRNVYPHHLGRQYHIMTQRGCPYSCSFCIESEYQEMFGKKDSLRRRSVDLVIAELVQAKRKHDVEAVMFYDDVFTVNRRWLREFAPRYKAEVGLPFWCYTYPRTTRPEDMRLLRTPASRR